MCKIIFILALSLACVDFGYSAHRENVQIETKKAATILQHALKCISETDVDPAILLQIRTKKYTADDNVKKFLLCAFKKAGISSKKGIIHTDKLLEIYPEKVNKEEISKVVESCKDNESPEAKDKVYNFFKCYQEKTPVRINMGN